MAQGSVKKVITADGVRWRVRVDLGPDPVTGQRRRPQRTYTTRREADAALAQWLVEIDRGLAVDPSTQSLGAYLEYWLTTSAQHTVRPTTYASYTYLVQTYILPALGPTPLQKLTGQHVQAFYAAKLADGGRASSKRGGLAPRTVRYLHAVLHRALKEAVRLRLIPRNPADDVTPPRGKRPPIKSWDAETAQRFLEVAREDGYSPLWQLGLHTGMRRGELLGLRWENVDLGRGVLHVREARVMAGKKVETSEPKTDSGKRTIALDPEDVEELKAHRTRQRERRLALGPAWHDSGLVLTSEVGTGLDPMNVYHRYVTLVKRAGVPRISFHAASRHTCATVAMTSGVHPRVVQELLGHADIAMTLGTYSHVLPEMHQEAASIIAQAMRRKSGTIS